MPVNVDFFQKVEPVEKRGKKTITVVLSTDDNYAPYAGVAICSLLENASKKYFYDIIILDGGMSPVNIKHLKKITDINGLSKLRYLDVKDLMTDAFSGGRNGHFTKATYMRLFVPYFFREHRLVLYLDCDTVVLNDISPLFEIEMGGNYIAAVPDSVFPEMVHGPERQAFFQNKEIPAVEYTRKHLGFADNKIHEYFNAGVMLFNIKAFTSERFSVLNDVEKYIYRGYHLFDQCIANILFRGRIKYLHQKWNLFQIKVDLQYLPDKLKQQFVEADKSPCILHFVSGRKPWNTMGLKNEEQFWNYCRKTPFYESLLKTCFAEDFRRRLESSLEEHRKETARLTKKIKRLQEAINVIANSVSWKITRPLRGFRLLLVDPVKFFYLLRGKMNHRKQA